MVISVIARNQRTGYNNIGNKKNWYKGKGGFFNAKF
jgi:hypothetical protein